MMPCNVSELERLCDAAAGCSGFNTNGWLQATIDPSSFKNTTACDLYVRDAGAAPAFVLPVAPLGPSLPVREDYHYPSEEPTEAAKHPPPAVVTIQNLAGGGCTVHVQLGPESSSVPVPGVSDGWEFLACFEDTTGSQRVVMQFTSRRWSSIVVAAAVGGPPAIVLRSSVGAAADVAMPRYNFTATEPDYFLRAVHERADYIGRRMLETSSNGEPTIVDAMRYESPGQEYALFGINEAPVKWVACPDGVIKRSDKALLELGDNDTAAGCDFSNPVTGYFLAAYLNVSQTHFSTFSAAQVACCAPLGPVCGGITKETEASGQVSFTLRAATTMAVGKPTDESWLCLSCAVTRSVVFDPWETAGFHPSAAHSEYKSGLLGGYLRAVSVCVWDKSLARGIELLTFGPSVNASHEVLIRLRVVNASTTGAATAPPYRYFHAGLSASREMDPAEGARLFFSELLGYHTKVEALLGGGRAAEIVLPHADQRQLDMSLGAIVLSHTDWIGSKQNYGAGAVYWGPGGSLSLTTLALINPMLWYGLTPHALELFHYYLDRFIAEDGRLPGKCGALPANQTVGNFADGYADYGRLIDMYVRAVLYSHNSTWATTNAPAVERIADYLVRLREQAMRAQDDTQGFIWGPAEHDRCHDPDFYFDISVWSWRGLVQLGRLHTDGFNATSPVDGFTRNQTYGEHLLHVAAGLRDDIDRAASQSAITDETGNVIFLPSVARAGPRLPSEEAYQAMWQGVNSSYANFRYWSETILAAGLDPKYELAMLSFRAEHGGTLGGTNCNIYAEFFRIFLLKTQKGGRIAAEKR